MKFKIGFFCEESGSSMIIDLFQDALGNHPAVESVDWEWVFPRFGKDVLTRVGAQYLIDNIKKYDLIFINLDVIPSRLKLFNDLNLWDKIIIYDIKDNQILFDPVTGEVSNEWVSKPLMYIKRSWEEYYLPVNREKMIPLDFAVLDAYLDVLPINYYDRRDLSITNTLIQGKRPGCPRDIITEKIKSFNWPIINDDITQLTLFYSIGWQSSWRHVGYRAELSPAAPLINWWYVYMHMLSRTKILFTGASHSAMGDTRTWEAFSRGPLVFVDHISIPQPNPMIAGEHYIKIDINDTDKMIQQTLELLKDETERARIAKAGHEHAIKYHSSKARVDYVMEEVIKRWVNR